MIHRLRWFTLVTNLALEMWQMNGSGIEDTVHFDLYTGYVSLSRDGLMLPFYPSYMTDQASELSLQQESVL